MLSPYVKGQDVLTLELGRLSISPHLIFFLSLLKSFFFQTGAYFAHNGKGTPLVSLWQSGEPVQDLNQIKHSHLREYAIVDFNDDCVCRNHQR